jgi:CHAT domain-containing protein
LARSVDRHLTKDEWEIFASVDVSAKPDASSAESDPHEIFSHVLQCEKCSGAAQDFAHIKAKLAELNAFQCAVRTPDCYAEEEWLSVAAGLLEKEQAERAIYHASQCDYCGPLFRNATEDLHDEMFSEEASLLGSLDNSSKAWQHGLAIRLSALKDKRSRPFGRRIQMTFGRWPRLALSIAGVFIVAFILWSYKRPRDNQFAAQRLIANAYQQQRTLNLRIPDAGYAPMRVERGDGASRMNRPPALLKAEAMIAEHLAEHPKDPAWLDARARADLLDGNYSAALEALGLARESKPSDPSILTDLATAHFQRAEGEDNPLDYGTAVELLGQVLSLNPSDPVALFNRAIASDRLYLYDQEIQDWVRYLQIDPSGDWADEAKRRLDEARNKQRRSLLTPPPLTDPTNVISLFQSATETADVTHSKSDDPVNAVDEFYLDIALTQWLPVFSISQAEDGNRGGKTNWNSTLFALARRLEVRHNDEWLTDVLAAVPSLPLVKAFGALARSIKLNALGDPAGAEIQSRLSEKLFRRARTKAGILRAQLETVYSLHRAQLPRACLSAAAPLLLQLSIPKYPWMRAQVLVEMATCDSMLEQLDLATSRVQEALSIATQSGYPAMWLRAIGISATIDTDEGNAARAWSKDLEGLQRYWKGSYPKLRGYQFYSDLGTAPEQENHKMLALALAREALSLVSDGSHAAFEAMARYRLASIAGNSEEAVEQYRSASQLFEALPQTSSTQVYRLNAQLSLAEIETFRSEYPAGLARLRAMEAEISEVSNQTIVLRFNTALGKVLLESGDIDGSEAALRRAIQIAARKLNSVNGDIDRMSWEQNAAVARRLLVYILFQKRGDPLGAFELWESSRFLPSTSAKVTDAKVDKARSMSVGLVAFPLETREKRYDRVLSHETLVSYAVLPTGTAIWISDNRGLYSNWVDAPSDELSLFARRFTELCSSPSSDLEELHQIGKRLFQLLIAPIVGHLDPSRTLIVEADGPIGQIPIQALTSPSGDYFGDNFTTLYSPRFCIRLDCSSPYHFSSSNRALVVGAPAMRGSDSLHLLPLPDANEEAASVAANFSVSKLLQGNQATVELVERELPRFDVFHFAGHAIASGSHQGLQLAPDELNASRTATLAGTHLQALDLHRCQLVVLSACSTGVEEKFGRVNPDALLRSLLIAGVPRVVASRWNVDSATASEFMKQFYRSLITDGNLAVALQNAARGVRRQRPTVHPYFWAAFSGFVTQE